MPPTSVFTSVASGASVCRREKASRRWGQRRGTPRRALRRHHVFLDVLDPPLADPRRHQFERAGDAGQQVVEVVRQAAGQLAHRLHLLRLAQLFFQLVALPRDARAIGDVAGVVEGTDDVAGLVAQRSVGDLPARHDPFGIAEILRDHEPLAGKGAIHVSAEHLRLRLREEVRQDLAHDLTVAHDPHEIVGMSLIEADQAVILVERQDRGRIGEDDVAVEPQLRHAIDGPRPRAWRCGR